MKKRIVICADGSWNRPERETGDDQPSNVLKLARAIKPVADDGTPQQVFYDWGVGSYYQPVSGGISGAGLHKNITDGYRYLVQNYHYGDEVYLFGFSRGAYTVRSLCGLINNCGIIKRPSAALIAKAFAHYKKPGTRYKPGGETSIAFRRQYSHRSRRVRFVGAWDTVGALGIPLSFLGLFEDRDEFYDTKLGSNVAIARHALALDEQRSDFEPTLWQARHGLDLQQVWFAGSHSDIGGSYPADKDGRSLADIPLQWLITQAQQAGLAIESHLLRRLQPSATATLHPSRRHFYRLRSRYQRPLQTVDGSLLVHRSVQQRWQQLDSYRPPQLQDYLQQQGQWPTLVD